MLLALAATMIVGRTYLQIFPVWLMGAGIYHLTTRDHPQRVWLRHHRALAIGVGLAAYAAAEAASHALDLGFVGSDLTIGLGFGLLMTIIIDHKVCLPAALTSLARFGARSSFSLYAAHFPIMLLARPCFSPVCRNRLRRWPVWR